MEVHIIKFKTGFTGALRQPDLSGELGSFDLRGSLKVAKPQKGRAPKASRGAQGAQ